MSDGQGIALRSRWFGLEGGKGVKMRTTVIPESMKKIKCFVNSKIMWKDNALLAHRHIWRQMCSDLVFLIILIQVFLPWERSALLNNFVLSTFNLIQDILTSGMLHARHPVVIIHFRWRKISLIANNVVPFGIKKFKQCVQSRVQRNSYSKSAVKIWFLHYRFYLHFQHSFQL